MITAVLMSLVALVPAAIKRLSAPTVATPQPTPTRGAPPAAVLLPDELDRCLQAVMTLVNDRTFGTAFLIDAQGNFLTASSLVEGSSSLRLIDNTGGSHAVRVIGIDDDREIALVRVAADGIPLPFGDGSMLQINDPLVLLASPKIANLQPSTSTTVKTIGGAQLGIVADEVPANLGGPVVGPGGKVLAVLTGDGRALMLSVAQPEITRWRLSSGSLLPLAPFPANLQLRGSESTSTPGTGATVDSVSPSRASAAAETAVTIRGSGFVDGAPLHVRFIPLASAIGIFDGRNATLSSGSSLTVTVPAGQVVQDYVIQLTNGDGTLISSRVAFTITP